MKSVALISLIFLTGCSWGMKDRQLFTTYTALNMVDMQQTHNIYANPEHYYEINPMLSMSNYIPFMISTNVLLFVIANSLPEWRTRILGFAVLIKGGLIINNASIGL